MRDYKGYSAIFIDRLQSYERSSQFSRVQYWSWDALLFFFSSRRRHTRSLRDWSSDVCSSDLQQASRVNFRGHIRQHELNGLKIRDGMTKGLALLRVTQSSLKCALCDSGGLRRYADAAAIESRKSDLISFAFLADAIPGGHFAIAEGKLGASRRVNAELFFFLAYSESRGSFFHHQRRDAFLALFRLRVHVHNRGIRGAAIGDPCLGAVDYVFVALAHSFRC